MQDPETNPTPEALDPLPTEDLLELERRRKRAERFGMPLNVDKIVESAQAVHETQEIPKNEPMEEEEEIRKIAEREKRFGVIMARPKADRHFEKRIENIPDENNKERSDALHIFGVDFLSTADLLAFFKSYNPQKVEWINDSSCNIIFDGERNAAEAFHGLTLTKKYDSNWRESFPIKKEGVNYSLQIRYATEKDTKEETRSGKDSQYYKYMKEKFYERKQKNSKFNKKRQYHDDYSSRIMNKRISKKSSGGKRKGNKDKDAGEEEDEELKNLREKQTQELLEQNREGGATREAATERQSGDQTQNLESEAKEDDLHINDSLPPDSKVTEDDLEL